MSSQENNKIGDITEKLKKLIALEENARQIGNKAEAENAAARIQEMLLKYNLDLQDIKDSSKEAEEARKIGTMVVNTKPLEKRHEGDLVQQLYNCLSHGYLTRVIVNNTTHKESGIKIHAVFIIGTKVNCEMVDYMARQLLPQIRRISNEAFKEYKANYGHEKRNTFKRGFYNGITSGIHYRLMRELDDLKEKEVSNPGMGLMVITHKKQVDDYTEEAHRPKQRRRENYTGNQGMMAGLRAAEKLQMNRGLENSKTKGDIK